MKKIRTILGMVVLLLFVVGCGSKSTGKTAELDPENEEQLLERFTEIAYGVLTENIDKREGTIQANFANIAEVDAPTIVSAFEVDRPQVKNDDRAPYHFYVIGIKAMFYSEDYGVGDSFCIVYNCDTGEIRNSMKGWNDPNKYQPYSIDYNFNVLLQTRFAERSPETGEAILADTETVFIFNDELKAKLEEQLYVPGWEAQVVNINAIDPDAGLELDYEPGIYSSSEYTPEEEQLIQTTVDAFLISEAFLSEAKAYEQFNQSYAPYKVKLVNHYRLFDEDGYLIKLSNGDEEVNQDNIIFNEDKVIYISSDGEIYLDSMMFDVRSYVYEPSDSISTREEMAEYLVAMIFGSEYDIVTNRA